MKFCKGLLIALTMMGLSSGDVMEAEKELEAYCSETNILYTEEIITVADSMLVEVTFYTSSVEETDSTPYITASGSRVRHGIIAISRDLFAELSYGDSVYVENHGYLEVRDTMHSRWEKSVDIWCESKKRAFQGGRKKLMMYYNFRKEKYYESYSIKNNT